MKKVLFTSTVARTAIFNFPFMEWFKEQGWEVHYASRDEINHASCDRYFPVCFSRSPASFDNVRAYKQLKAIINQEGYNIIHCHTPMAGVVTRLAARGARKQGTKVLYTAHGFHFFKGAPLVNWLLYYPVEKFMSRFADCMFVINNEDYALTQAKGFKAGRVVKIDGVGVDLSRFTPADADEKSRLRKEHGYTNSDFILLYVAAELSPGKNHKFLIDSLPLLIPQIPSIKLLLVGVGKSSNHLTQLAQRLGVTKSVDFLGYRNDIPDLCRIADIQVSPSMREGLPVNILEGMATGLPIVCTTIRGHVDLITHNKNGMLFPKGDNNAFCKAIEALHGDPELRQNLGHMAMEDVKRFSLTTILPQMANIYKIYM